MLNGSCHCGAVTFEVDGTIDKLLECNCSHCSIKGMLMAFFPREAFKVTAGGDKLTTYTFNAHKIRHQFCQACGVEAFAMGAMPDGAPIAAVNARSLVDFDLDSVPREPFNGRDA